MSGHGRHTEVFAAARRSLLLPWACGFTADRAVRVMAETAAESLMAFIDDKDITEHEEQICSLCKCIEKYHKLIRTH